MLAAHWLKAIGFGTLQSLLFIIFVLLGSILLSTFFPKKND
jgi:hypothetical protein